MNRLAVSFFTARLLITTKQQNRRDLIMSTVHAYAATEANGIIKPFEYELGSIGPQEVDIAVESCGICHSDLSMLQDA
jgi:hypothetical protein